MKKPGRKPKYRHCLTLTRFDEPNDKFIRRVVMLGKKKKITKTDVINFEFERVRMNYTAKQFVKILAEKRNTI